MEMVGNPLGPNFIVLISNALKLELSLCGSFTKHFVHVEGAGWPNRHLKNKINMNSLTFRYFQVHLSHPPATDSPGCKQAWQDYVSLAKTRLTDLKASFDQAIDLMDMYVLS